MTSNFFYPFKSLYSLILSPKKAFMWAFSLKVVPSNGVGCRPIALRHTTNATVNNDNRWQELFVFPVPTRPCCLLQLTFGDTLWLKDNSWMFGNVGADLAFFYCCNDLPPINAFHRVMTHQGVPFFLRTYNQRVSRNDLRLPFYNGNAQNNRR